MKKRIFTIMTFVLLIFTACQPGPASLHSDPNGDISEEEADPPEVAIGERLFRETRFAQFFAAHFNGDVNTPLSGGDSVMDESITLGSPLLGPYRGKSMNCAACHLVDEQAGVVGGGMRTYSDFARRSPIPHRVEDNKTLTPRNSPPLVNSTIAPSDKLFFHFDAEFGSIENLVKAAYTGRNYGWLSTEGSQALAHIIKVIREDNGKDELAQNYGGLSYKTVLSGTDSNIPEEYRLPPGYRIEVDQATDEEIFNAIAKIVGAYVNGLIFSQDTAGQFNASPYDQFLRKNHLPTSPEEGETDLEYSRKLLAAIQALENPYFISSKDGAFQFHNQNFVFGSEELEGLKIFFTEGVHPLSSQVLAAGKVGNCIACHAAPAFTDFKFHNTGAAQEEYDAIHGEGAFAALSIPDLATRQADPNAYLPDSSDHPAATGIFKDIPSLAQPGHTDLGLWNMFANPDHPFIQTKLRNLLCEMNPDLDPCDDSALLPLTIALFKTPGLRDLGDGAPYMHTGQFDEIEDVLLHYKTFSEKSRNAQVRNAAPELMGMSLSFEDLKKLGAFLRSLNEDYN